MDRNGHINGSAANTVMPSDKVDWPNLKFALAPVNAHVQYTWKDGQWGKAQLVNEPYVKLHVGSVALNYGQSVFEGMKAYRHEDNSVRLFRPWENSARINHSAATVCMPPIPEEMFLEACRLCVAANLEFVPPYGHHGSKGAMYLRPLYFGSGELLQLDPPSEFTFVIWCTPAGSLYGSAGTSAPGVAALVLEDFDRSAPKGTGSAKLAGNYAPVFAHTAAAKKAGYPITLHLDSATRTFVDEFSTSNCLLIKYANGQDTPEADRLKGVTLYVPESPSILKSVTTKSIAEIAKKAFGWNVVVGPVPFADVKAGQFDEVAAAGTAAVITPVSSISYTTSSASTGITRIPVGDGKTAGPAFLALMKHLCGIQSGDIQDDFGWMWPKEGVQKQ